MDTPGGLWNRLLTLRSGVLKKAVAMELYSPSEQKSYKETMFRSESDLIHHIRIQFDLGSKELRFLPRGIIKQTCKGYSSLWSGPNG